MKKKMFENYLAKLATTKSCIDTAEMERYIADHISYCRNLLDREIQYVEEFINNRYERYGVITEEDEIEAWKQGYYTLCKLGVTLDDVRRMIEKIGFEKGSSMEIRIQQDWNYAGHLLNDYLQLENANLLTYLQLLKASQQRIQNKKMYSTYSDKQLDAVYTYLCKKEWICPSENGSRDFQKIFRACGLDVTEKIRINTNRNGAKAYLRVVIEVLTSGFSATLVNQYFCDCEGKDLKLASHNRATSYDDGRNELVEVLAMNT